MRTLRIMWLRWRHPERKMLTGVTYARWLLLEGWNEPQNKTRIPVEW